jgi:hypothetical protein
MQSLFDQVEEATKNDPPGLRYQIICGEHTYPGGSNGGDLDRGALLDTLKWLMIKYENTVDKWLAGIVVYSFKNQMGSLEGFEGQKAYREWLRFMKGIDERKIENAMKRRKKKSRK